jgi:hypothetical protein
LSAEVMARAKAGGDAMEGELIAEEEPVNS